jgi:APA family basic amino acid/polyamine antiporter
MYGQSRIFFVMARDGLLPQIMSRVSARTGAPVIVTVFTAALVALVAGVFPLGKIAEVANAGTLAAFVAVAVCMLVMRRREPTRRRPFRAPVPWVVGPLAITGCIYLFFSLAGITREIFVAWNALGLAAYFLYARGHSRLGQAEALGGKGKAV